MSELPPFSEEDAKNIGDVTELDLILHTGMKATVQEISGHINLEAGLAEVFEAVEDRRIIEATRQDMEDKGEL